MIERDTELQITSEPAIGLYRVIGCLFFLFSTLTVWKL
jgi:hypothetical protein